jgi:hypothetical protein
MTDRLGRLLLVPLEVARVNADLPVLAPLHSFWGLDSWRGIGAVEGGMGGMRRSLGESTVISSRGSTTSDLVTNHKALNPTRIARNNTNATLVSTAFNKISISTVFIGTPVSSALYLRRSELAIGAQRPSGSCCCNSVAAERCKQGRDAMIAAIYAL